MRRASRLWTKFRALPFILQLGVWLALALIAVPVLAEEGDVIAVRARAICEGGRLTSIELFTPVPGVITVPIPPDICQRQPQGGAPAPKARRPGLSI